MRANREFFRETVFEKPHLARLAITKPMQAGFDHDDMAVRPSRGLAIWPTQRTGTPRRFALAYEKAVS